MKRHPFHIVDPSPWPLLVSSGVFFLVLNAVAYFHFISNALNRILLGLFFLTLLLFFWFRDIVREGTYFRLHSENVMVALRLGFLLFIVSEAMLFFSFFWAFFHSSLAPSFSLGSVWPPFGMAVISPWELPLLNTLILLTSGAAITLAHLSIINGNRDVAIDSFFLTIFHALLFTSIQAYEYLHAPFSLSDGIYGSVFFMLTGFHGFHVLIGTIFILVQFVRYLSNHFTPKEHFGFEASAWYWHFVDVVWLLVFILIYVWGNLAIL